MYIAFTYSLSSLIYLQLKVFIRLYELKQAIAIFMLPLVESYRIFQVALCNAVFH